MLMPVRLVSLACQARPQPRAARATARRPGHFPGDWQRTPPPAPWRPLRCCSWPSTPIILLAPPFRALSGHTGDTAGRFAAAPAWLSAMATRYLTADSTSSVSTPPTSPGCRNAIAAPIDPWRGLESSSLTPAVEIAVIAASISRDAVPDVMNALAAPLKEPAD